MLRLAPAYDMINATGYRGMTHDMAFAIGGTKQLEDITLDSFRLAAKEAGLGERMALNRLHDLIQRFRPALTTATERLLSQHVLVVEELQQTILRTGGIAYLSE